MCRSDGGHACDVGSFKSNSGSRLHWRNSQIGATRRLVPITVAPPARVAPPALASTTSRQIRTGFSSKAARPQPSESMTCALTVQSSRRRDRHSAGVGISGQPFGERFCCDPDCGGAVWFSARAIRKTPGARWRRCQMQKLPAWKFHHDARLVKSRSTNSTSRHFAAMQ